MKKSKTYKVVLILLLVVAIIFWPIILLVLGLVSWFGGTLVTSIAAYLFVPNPPKPEIEYGEFPFEVVYEIDGEVATIEDIYVCEYVGADLNEGWGKSRIWKGYVKSTGEDYLELLEDGNLKLVCSLGGPKYYMSDPSTPEEEYAPSIYYRIYPNEYGGTSSGTTNIDLYLRRYKIKLISWEFSEPIQNSYKHTFISGIMQRVYDIFGFLF